MARVDSRDMVYLAAAANSFQAHLWQNALQESGIRCQVLGDALEAGIGDISGLSVEVWVDPAQRDRALAYLRHHQHP